MSGTSAHASPLAPAACTVTHVHFIIMGCGRVGAAAAISLEARGHSVAVIDQNAEAFRRLPSTFEGQRVTGLGFDRGVLTEADVAAAYGFAAVSSGDNSNILAARVVRETFGVSNVVARIYDPARAELYQRLGISTVATVPWAADQVLREILPMDAVGVYSDPSGKITLTRLDPHPAWVGTSLRDIEAATGTRLGFIRRFGNGILPGAGTLFQAGDVLYFLVPTDRLDATGRVLARAPEVSEP
ncbi:MAG: TrkA family potassium uptake protein [Bifidobacteriaceae bacterium]|jgi:trk system potassium uptake protein TrkA|nr:TrkA family potassium uptake protein [Bifidobacteriaceae bacterium]